MLLALGKSEIDGIKKHVADAERVDITITIDTRRRRCVHIEEQLFEVDILTLQNGHQRIVTLTLNMQLHRRQQSAQGGLVDDLLVVLGISTIGEHGDLLQQVFIITTGIELDDKVATLGAHQCSISRGIDVQSDELGVEGFDGVANADVADESADVMRQLHIGSNVDMSTKSDGQGLLDELHLIDVDVVDISSNRGVELLRVQQGIDVDLAINQCVTTVDMSQRMTIMHVSLNSHIGEIPTAIAQLVHMGIGHQTGAGREKVGTLPFHIDIGRNGIDGVARHEVMDVQLVDIQLRLIAHGIGIELATQLHRTLALMGSHISGIVGTIGLHTPSSCHPIRQAIVALHVARQHGGNKIHVLRLGLELHISTQLLRTVQVGDKACCMGLESGRQRDIEVGELHILHVTLQLTIKHQGLVGPLVAKTLRHRVQKGHEVLLAHHGPQAQLHLTGIDGIGQRQRHIQLDVDVGVGGLQVELRQTDSPILHRQRTRQVGDL